MPDEKEKASNIELIEGLNAEALRKRMHGDEVDISILGQKPQHIFNSDGALIEFLRAQDLHDFLGVKDIPGDIYLEHCILPHHESGCRIRKRSVDRRAGIYCPNGKFYYHCFGCMNDDEHYGIIQLVMSLSLCSYDDALDFLCDVYGLSVVASPWADEWQGRIEKVIRFIQSPELRQKYPDLGRILKTRAAKISAILYEMSRKIRGELTYEGRPAFTMGMDRLALVSKFTMPTLVSTMGLLSYLGIIIKIPNVYTEGSSELLKRKKTEAIDISLRKGYSASLAAYALPKFSEEDFSEWNRMAGELLEHHFQVSTFDREWLIRTFGVEAADKAYPSWAFENAEGPSEEAQERTLRLTRFLLDQIEEQGYCEERYILEKFPGKTMSKQWKRSKAEILLLYGLQRKRLSKKLCTQLGVEYTSPRIVILPI